MIKSILCFAALLSVIEGGPLLPDCDSFLRLLQPWRFKHCSPCSYSSWGTWNRIGNLVTSIHCKSGYAYIAERTRADSKGSSECKNTLQRMYQCDATVDEKVKMIITQFNLKKKPNHSNRNISISLHSISKRDTCSHTRICASTGSTGKRHINEQNLRKEEPLLPDASTNFKKLDNNIIPEEFNLQQYLSSIKANRQKRQNLHHYILIILDASGSVGSANFQEMTDFSAKFARYACGQKVAVMSFSTNVYAEYCFDCEQGTEQMESKIKSIPFSNGLTASGDAINCACDFVLKKGSKCGFPQNIDSTAIVQVIFITDGRSNRGTNVCSAASTCWQTVSQYVNQVIVTPLYITNGGIPNYQEINCIKGNYGADGIQVESFEDFKRIAEGLESQTPTGCS